MQSVEEKKRFDFSSEIIQQRVIPLYLYPKRNVSFSSSEAAIVLKVNGRAQELWQEHFPNKY